MLTTYDVITDAFGPPTARRTNEAVTCHWGLRFNDDDDNVIHVIIHNRHPDNRPPPPGELSDQIWYICGVDSEPTMKAVIAELHEARPGNSCLIFAEYASEDASEGGGGGAAAEE